MTVVPRLCLACTLLAAAMPACGPVLADGIQAGAAAPRRDPCADYGSFAVVDAPGGNRRDPIVAHSHSPCADLPNPQQQPQVYMNVDVQIGGQGQQPGETQPGTLPSNGSASAPGRAPAPVLRVQPGRSGVR